MFFISSEPLLLIYGKGGSDRTPPPFFEGGEDGYRSGTSLPDGGRIIAFTSDLSRD